MTTFNLQNSKLALTSTITTYIHSKLITKHVHCSILISYVSIFNQTFV